VPRLVVFFFVEEFIEEPMHGNGHSGRLETSPEYIAVEPLGLQGRRYGLGSRCVAIKLFVVPSPLM
jgi:hypothetical protein